MGLIFGKEDAEPAEKNKKMTISNESRNPMAFIRNNAIDYNNSLHTK